MGAPLALGGQFRVPSVSSLTNAIHLVLEVMYAMSAYHCSPPRDRDPSKDYSRFDIVSRYAGKNCGAVHGNVDVPVEEYTDIAGLTAQSTTHSLVTTRSVLAQAVVVYDMFGEGCFWDEKSTREQGLSPRASICLREDQQNVVVEANGEKLRDVICWLFSHAHAINIDAPAGMCMYHEADYEVKLSRESPQFTSSGRRRMPKFEEAHALPRTDLKNAVLCPHCVARELCAVPAFAKEKLGKRKSNTKAKKSKRPKTPNAIV